MGSTKKGGRGLPKRRPATSSFTVQVADETEVEEAREGLERAERALTMSLALKSEDARKVAQEAHAAAKARLDACFDRIIFRELPAPVLEAIRTAYPDPDDIEDRPASWQNPFFHCLAATSHLDDSRSPADWAALFKDFDVARVADQTAEWAEWCADFSLQTWYDLMGALNTAQFRPRTTGLPKG